jgi:hypothetical protein
MTGAFEAATFVDFFASAWPRRFVDCGQFAMRRVDFAAAIFRRKSTCHPPQNADLSAP